MRFDWKRFRVDIGRFRVRLKTIAAALICGAVSALIELQYVDLQPLIRYLVGDENKALFYGTLVAILMGLLRAMTTGPLVERVDREED